MNSLICQVKQLGMDVHKHFSRVTALDGTGETVFRQRLEHADRQRLRDAFRRWPAGTPVVLEGTFGWSWMADELTACGLEPHLTSGRKIDGWRKSRGLAKNNRLDADLLAEVFSEPKRWWEVWLPPQEIRQRREWMRYRMGLVQTQTAFKNRIQSTLHRHGVLHPYSDLFGRQGRLLLAELMRPDDQRMPESAKATIRGTLDLLDQTRRHIAKITKELRRQITSDKQADIWRTLPGIAWVLAYTICAEVGDIQRFKNAGCLATYSMLAPRDNDSGEENPNKPPIGRHIPALGRTTLKCAFLQASKSAVKKSPHMRDVFNRITDNGKRNRSRGYIAVAHELCRVGYACVKKNRPYSETPPARPGARRLDRQQPHSDVGQPAPAMVTASFPRMEDALDLLK